MGLTLAVGAPLLVAPLLSVSCTLPAAGACIGVAQSRVHIIRLHSMPTTVAPSPHTPGPSIDPAPLSVLPMLLQMQELDQAPRQLEHPYMKLFGPARSADSPAEEPASVQQAAAADVQQSIIVVEVTLVGQEGSAQQPLLPLLQGLGSRLGSPTSGRAASEANAEVAAAGTAADDSRWSMAAHLANVEEYLQSLLPAQPAQQHSQPRQQHRHAHSRSHVQHPWVQEGVALPTRPPLSPLKLAALDTVFVAATVVALVCSVLLAADIMRYGLWPQQGTAASHGSGYPAGALVAVGPAEQQPMLIVVAADEVAAAQQAGYTKL